MKLLLPIFLLLSLAAQAGNRYTLTATSGGVTVSQTTDGHALVAGDTIALNPAGTYTYLQAQGVAGSSGAHIVILGNGAQLTSPASFQQPEWYNSSYIDVVNVVWFNWYGKNTMDYGLHDILFSGGSVTWNASSNRNNGQAWMQWDNASSPVSMVFDGTRAKTFYNIRFTGATWAGITDTYFMTMGTGWGGADDNRSICTDFRFDHLLLSDFRNTASGGGIDGNQVGGVFGTCFNIKVDHNQVERMAGMAAFQRAHIEAFYIYGNGEYNNNRMDSSYAQFLRAVPMRWTGLAGYGKGLYMWNNIIHNSYDYSAFEVSSNNAGDRTSTYNIFTTNDTCVFNTVYRTRASSYLAGSAGATYRYHAVVIDDVNQTPNINYVAYNVIGEPESDFTYNPASFNNYIYAFVSASNSNLTVVGNQNFQHWTTAQWDDTTSFVPAAGSTFIDAGAAFSFRTVDFYDNTITGTPDAGAVERATGSAPSCTTNSAPTNGSTIGTLVTATLAWNTVAAADSFYVYGPYFGGTPPASPTYRTAALTIIVSNLIPASTYRYYIAPKNIFGIASGCATTFSTFTTRAPKIIYIQRRQ